jgi:hypothetical protein
MRIPTRYELKQIEKDKNDIKVLGGVCAVIIVIAAGLLFIG